MLVLQVRKNDYLKIGENVKIWFRRDGDNLKVAIDAPRDISVLRGAVAERGSDVMPQWDRTPKAVNN
jgi:sRNA-binding carbon storage regulator CsrA